MATEVLAKSPAGNIEQVPNLKRRKLAVYWRPHIDSAGNKTWIQTLALPADALSKEAYLAKGFRLTPPGSAEESKPTENEEALYAEIAQLRAEVAEAKAKGRKPRARANSLE